jgi:hypothetical protein
MLFINEVNLREQKQEYYGLNLDKFSPVTTSLPHDYLHVQSGRAEINQVNP